MKMKTLPLLVFVLALLSVCAGARAYGSGGGKDIKVGKIVKAGIRDKKIVITNDDGKLIDYRIKGICYAPDVNGDSFCENYEDDLPLIKAAGANSLRTYRPLGCYETKKEGEPLDFAKSKRILDDCLNEGLTVTVGFSYEDMAEGGLMDAYISELGSHPAILMIALGNEYNYHYGDWFSKEEWLERLGDAVVRIRRAVPDRIIATVHGEMPSQEEYVQYVNSGVDLVMMNMYRGSNFGFAAENWHKMSDTMPWVLGEFGRSSRSGEGKDTSNIQVSYLQSMIRSMENGYLFKLVDDPGKGDGQLNDVIGKEDSLGIYSQNRKPKKAVKAVKAEYDKIQGAKYIE